MASAAAVSSTAAWRRAASATAFENVGAHSIAGAELLGDRRVHAAQRQAARRQPVGQRVDGGRVAIVEMTARREQLDLLEPVAGDLRQVLPVEPLVVIEVRGNPELHVLSGVYGGSRTSDCTTRCRRGRRSDRHPGPTSAAEHLSELACDAGRQTRRS